MSMSDWGIRTYQRLFSFFCQCPSDKHSSRPSPGRSHALTAGEWIQFLDTEYLANPEHLREPRVPSVVCAD